MGNLGLQESTGNRSPITQAPGEYTGAIVIAIEGIGLFVIVPQKKWERVKGILKLIFGQFSKEDDIPNLDLNDLKQEVGLTFYLYMAYPLITPFLKVIYLKMHSWR